MDYFTAKELKKALKTQELIENPVQEGMTYSDALLNLMLQIHKLREEIQAIRNKK